MSTESPTSTGDRRQGGDRRRRDRRRAGPERTVVVEITRNVLRAAVLAGSPSGEGDTVEASAEPWRKEAADLRSPEAVAELTAGFRQLASRHALQGNRLHVVLSGEYCVTRVVRGPTEDVRSEVKQIEERSRMYLALGPGEKAVVTHTKPLSARVSHALTVACHQETLQNVRAAVEAVGLHLDCVEPELTALSRAAARLPDLPEGPYLLALVDGETLELGHCLAGELITDYRAGGRVSPPELPELIRKHMARLERHGTRFVGDGDASISRVYLAGEPQTVNRAKSELAGTLPVEVRTIDAPQVQASWQIAAESMPAATATTLGALLAAYYPVAQRDCPNLLDYLIAQSREPLRPVVLRLLAPLAAVLLVAAALSLVVWKQREQTAALEAELAPLATVQGRATELRLQKQRATQKLAELTTLAEQLPPRSGRTVVQAIANSMPDDVWLRRFVITDRKLVSLDGASYLPPGVYDFVNWLEQNPVFDQVALQGTNEGGSEVGPVTNFSLEAVLADQPPVIQEVARRE